MTAVTKPKSHSDDTSSVKFNQNEICGLPIGVKEQRQDLRSQEKASLQKRSRQVYLNGVIRRKASFPAEKIKINYLSKTIWLTRMKALRAFSRMRKALGNRFNE